MPDLSKSRQNISMNLWDPLVKTTFGMVNTMVKTTNRDEIIKVTQVKNIFGMVNYTAVNTTYCVVKL